MTRDQRIAQVQAKLTRAKKHVKESEHEVAEFLRTRPYAVATRRQPESNRLVYYVSAVRPTPDCLPLIVGDAIQGLTSSLDHLAYQIVCSDTADAPPHPRAIYFPIGESAQDYVARKPRRMHGASAASLAAIDALQPFRGGNERYWQLSRLNNIDKHRTLLTVGSHHRSVDLGRHAATEMLRAFPDMPGRMADAVRNMHAFFRPADTGFPLAAGFELLILRPEDQPDPEMQFRFDVALHEQGVCESASLLETLHELTTLVEQTLTALGPLLRDSP